MAARSVTAEILNNLTVTSIARAASSASAKAWRCPPSVGADDKTATREIAGIACFSIRIRLSEMPGASSSIPVVTPPGRLALLADPAPMISGPRPTIGMVGFALWMATAAGVEAATMSFTPNFVSSAVSFGYRVGSLSAIRTSST